MTGFGRGYSGAGSIPGAGANSVISPVASPAMMKPPTMPPKPKATAPPPVATFQTKTFDYQEPKKAGKGPDMMM